MAAGVVLFRPGWPSYGRTGQNVSQSSDHDSPIAMHSLLT